MEDTWLTCHRQFVKELDEWDKQGGWDVLFYGDSIVEEWRCVCSSQPHNQSNAAAIAALADLAKYASRTAGTSKLNNDHRDSSRRGDAHSIFCTASGL